MYNRARENYQKHMININNMKYPKKHSPIKINIDNSKESNIKNNNLKQIIMINNI